MPALAASCAATIASSRVVGPQTYPVPPPPRVRQQISPSLSTSLFSIVLPFASRVGNTCSLFSSLRLIGPKPSGIESDSEPLRQIIFLDPCPLLALLDKSRE